MPYSHFRLVRVSTWPRVPWGFHEGGHLASARWSDSPGSSVKDDEKHGIQKKKGNSKQGKSQECQTGFKQGKLFALNSKLLGMSDNSPYLEGNLRSRRTWAFEVVEGKMAHETYTSTKRMIMFNYVQLCWIYGLLSDIAQSLELKAQTCASLKSRGGQLAFIDHPCRRTHRRTLRIWKASKGYNYIDM